MSRTSFGRRTWAALLGLCGIMVGLAGSDLHAQGRSQGPATAPATTASSGDQLLGWFRMTKRGRLIPVFKRDGTYYSVGPRGIEVPLKACPEGLEWNSLPSSMEGTKIGFDAGSNAHYIIINDYRSQLSGEKQPMTRMDQAPELLDSAAPKPQSNADFVGWYQAVWCPVIRYEIRKDGERFLLAMQLYLSGAWRPGGDRIEIKPLAEGLGFSLGQTRTETASFTYNEALGRFELTNRRADRQSTVLRMPMARVPAPPSPEGGEAPKPAIPIGILP